MNTRRGTALAATLMLAIAAPSHALFDGTFAASKCIAGKLGCVAKMKSCLLACHEKAVRNGVVTDPACLAKCRDGFDQSPAVPGRGCFAKAEAKGDCGLSLGDAATVGARIDAHVHEVARSLVPQGNVPANVCSSRKLTCFRKYDACVLKLVRTAAQRGTAISDLAKCTRYLDGSSTSCVGKLETKYCGPDSIGCDPVAPACQTFEDQSVLRLRDDTFAGETIDGLLGGPRDANTQRCSGDTAVVCTSAPGGVAGCGGPLGTCEFHLGAPVPQGWGGIGVCTSTQWNGPLTGTFDQASGASTGSAAVIERLFIGISSETPCPTCQGDASPNDGLAGGFCYGGTHNGDPCDANEAFPVPSYGSTSLDCPPSSFVTSTPLAFALTNDGTLAKTVTPTSPTCNGAPGKQCLCASCSFDSSIPCENDAQCATAGAGVCTNPAGAARQPHACIDNTSSPGDGTICADAGNGNGVCPEGPFDQHCAIDTFRSCLVESDCPSAGDRCITTSRSCYLGYDGNLGDTVRATGSHDEARNGAAVTTFAALFCQPPTNSAVVNTIIGLPGPGRFQVLGVGENDGGPSCPTRASFVATNKGAATDLGWNGLVHGQPRPGGAKITVATTCTGSHPNCSCTYTGPIANPAAP